MMQRRRGQRRAPVAAGVLLVGVVGILMACEGRTLLEGELLNAPPELTLDQMVTSSQVHPGTAARLRIRAESRTAGIASIRVDWTGAAEGTLTRAYPDGPSVVVLDTTIAISRYADPGDIVFTAAATSMAGVPGELVFTVRVIDADVDPPEVSVASSIPDRVERDDSLAVTIRCRDLGDAGQLAWCGYSVLFFPTDGDTVTVVRRDTVPGQDTAAIRDMLPIEGFDPATLPTELNIEVHGFAIDASGNCSAGVREAWSREFCVGTEAILADVESEPARVTVVASTTITRDRGGTLEELAVDEKRGLVYGSVIDRNRIEVLDFLGPREQAWQADILVGSRPAGIVMDTNGDTLIVANSGGTSLSFVDLDNRREQSRLETPNASLYTLPPGCGGAPISFWSDYGDRPLRVAQDSFGVIMYSTTSGGPIRMVEHRDGWQNREVNIMLWSDVIVSSPGSWAVAYVDSMTIKPESIYECNPETDIITIYDHVPGHLDQRITGSSTLANFPDAVEQIRDRGSDIIAFQDSAWATGYWDVGQDARFGTSRDRSTIAVADGSRAWTWIATDSNPGFHDRLISWYLSIDDLSNNMELGIEGVSVDRTGQQFAIRGGDGVVYFDDLLRVHGSHEFDVLSGPAGIALHPDQRLAFAPTNDRSVLILETGTHYQQQGEMPLVENLVGPVHFSLRRSDDPETLIGRIHGVNESGNVVTLPVRQADLSETDGT